MAYLPNTTWTVADADRLLKLARSHHSSSEIAQAMNRTETAGLKFCEDNGIFVRSKPARARA